MQPGIRIYSEPTVPVDLRAQVLAFGPMGPHTAHDPALRPLSMLLVANDRVLAALDILSKDIVHRSQCFSASGLSRVITDPNERRKGYGRKLVRAAFDVIAASGVDLGIFTCDRPLRQFYEGCGWQTLVGTTLIGGTPERPFCSDQFDKVTLAGFFSARARLHADAFNHCRVALYSGEIDRLW